MNVLFLTMFAGICNVQTRGIYTDLIRKFRDEGHNVYIVYPNERRTRKSTKRIKCDGVHLLGVKTLNVTKSSVVEKGIGQILLEYQFKSAINKYYDGAKFDLILYSTPPIAFTRIINYLKTKNVSAKTYLLLKDIFPQNAVDLGMFSKGSLMHKLFRNKEISLYKKSDYIGCMSPANVEFILNNNPFISKEKVELAPNSIELKDSEPFFDSYSIRQKYNLPFDKSIFIYGGNLGRPQGIDFLIKCLDANKYRTDCHFLIVGSGTEYKKLEYWYNQSKAKSVTVYPSLPKNDYDLLVQSCDVGLIFLDHRFTIPNFPSRLLSYLEYKIPIIAATDIHTDLGIIAQKNGFGFWCESIYVEDFTRCVDRYVKNPGLIKTMGQQGYQYLLKHYQVQETYQAIIQHFK